MKLTDRQADVFRYLIHFQATFGYMPTTRDIADHFKFNQTSSCNHLRAIQEKGYIKRHGKKARAIQITMTLP